MTVRPVDPLAYRHQVHQQALEAAHAMLIEHGWDQLRFGEVAVAIGVSRPTLYAAFANKQALAEALVLRETDRFLLGIGAVLDGHPRDPAAAITAAVAFTLAEADSSPVLHAALTRSSESLLPLLTTRSSPVLAAATTALTAWFLEHVPGVAPERVVEGVDALVRLVVSHLVQPADDPTQTPQRLARLALSYLDVS